MCEVTCSPCVLVAEVIDVCSGLKHHDDGEALALPRCSPRQKYGHNFDAGHSLVHFGPDYGLRLRGINENWTDYGLRLRGVGENWTDYALRLQGCAMATG